MLMSAPRSNIALSLRVSSRVPLASPLMLVERMLMVDLVLLCRENGFMFFFFFFYFYFFFFFFFVKDDMIDDVRSFVAAAEVLKDRGAYKIYVMATHGLLSSDAPRLIEDSPIDEVFFFIFLIIQFNFLKFKI